MPEVAQKYQDNLKKIKDNIEYAYQYFLPNCERWHEYMKFVFLSSLSDDDISMLKTLKKPQLEFNILEAYVSRLRGEFSKQEPSIEVMADYGENVDPMTIQVVEGIIRHILWEGNKNGCEYRVYSDLLAGGFSVYKVWTDYIHPMSFDQVIYADRVFDPTLCGFDPIARQPSKSDGRFCFEMYPKTKDEFVREYPDVDLSSVTFRRDVEGFNWSYKTQKEDILLIVDYYEKKKRKKRIVKLADGKTMTTDEYKEFLDKWTMEGRIEQPPAVVGNPRTTEIEVICRYRLIENQVIEYIETDYKYLPLVFIDGNSAWIKDTPNGALQQHTRPYVYNAKGTQKLKNFAGQTLANELENMVMHKFKVPKEGIPTGYEDAYTNIQQANTLVYNAFKDNDPNVPLPPPQEIARVPAPPEVTNTFAMADQITQSILGSYDAALGINNNQLSGIAIVEGATQSNAAAMPYVVGFMQGLNQVGQIIMDLIPKYYITPRTVPVATREGQKGYVVVNKEGEPSLEYDSNALHVKVEAGVSFAIQKSRALQQIVALMQASPIFGQFMNQDGLEVLVDNLEIRGVDQLKSMAKGFMDKMKKQQQMQQQMAMQQQQNNPQVMRMQLEKAKLAQNAQQAQIENQLKAAELANDKETNDTDRLRILATLENDQQQRLIQKEEIQTRKTAQAVDLAVKAADMSHRHVKDVVELHHKLKEPKRKNKEQEPEREYWEN